MAHLVLYAIAQRCQQDSLPDNPRREGGKRHRGEKKGEEKSEEEREGAVEVVEIVYKILLRTLLEYNRAPEQASVLSGDGEDAGNSKKQIANNNKNNIWRCTEWERRETCSNFNIATKIKKSQRTQYCDGAPG